MLTLEMLTFQVGSQGNDPYLNEPIKAVWIIKTLNVHFLFDNLLERARNGKTTLCRELMWPIKRLFGLIRESYHKSRIRIVSNGLSGGNAVNGQFEIQFEATDLQP